MTDELDDLPVDIDTDSASASSGEDEGTSIWTWIAGAGGVVAAVYILNWLFGILVGLMSFLVYYGAIALLVYGGYRGIKYLVSDDTSTAADEQVALPDDIDVDSQLDSEGVESELGSDLESELAGGDIDGELEGIEANVEVDDVEVERDEELEKKFEKLEQEVSE